MSTAQIFPPFQVFTDQNGAPLEAGFIYIGSGNQNPEATPVPVFFDLAMTIPAAQPIRTIAGYPSHNGSPARIYSSITPFSITVRDKNGVIVFSMADAQSESLPETLILDTIGTGNLWTNDTPPAKIHRMLDRLFIGDVTANDGANPAGTTSWLGVSPQPGLGWMERSATAASYATKGAIGFVGAAHTSGLASGAALGLIGVGVNDNETNAVPVWGLYLDAKSYAGALASTFGCELEVANLGTYVDGYSANPRKTIGLDIGAGADPAVNGATDSVTFGLRFINNGANFGTGISFGSNSLRSHTDAEGLTYFRAMVLRNSQAIAWEGTAGERLGDIRSNVTLEAQQTSIFLSNNNVFLKGAAGARIAQFSNVASAVNYNLFSNSAAGASPTLSVAGTDSDIDVRIVPKGTNGRLRFGTLVASGDVPIGGYIEIKDSAGNIRKLAVVS